MAVEGQNVSAEPGVVRILMLNSAPVTTPTTGAWCHIGAFGFEGSVHITGIYTTAACTPMIYGWTGEGTPAANNTGTAFSATLTANGFLDINNAPDWLRMNLPANTTTGATVLAWYCGRSGYGVR